MYEKICQLVESLKISENGGLSAQAELNLKTGRSDMPKIRIIEDDLLTLLHTPLRPVVFFGMTENHGRKEYYFLCPILMIITT